MKQGNCIICGKYFETKVNKITCSKECSKKNARNKQMEWREVNKLANKKYCKICGKDFFANGNKQTCSDECAKQLKSQTRIDGENRRKQERKVRKIKKASLVQSEKKARDMGMSYGMYMAYMSGRIELE